MKKHIETGTVLVLMVAALVTGCPDGEELPDGNEEALDEITSDTNTSAKEAENETGECYEKRQVTHDPETSGIYASGYTYCREGSLDRSEAIDCVPLKPDCPLDSTAFSSGLECATNADCTDGDNGRCVSISPNSCGCEYPRCQADVDCQDGEACVCGSRGGVCRPAACKTNDDCPAATCGADFGHCQGMSFNISDIVGLHCRTANDECISKEDCIELKGDDDPFERTCRYLEREGRWVCEFVASCD